MSTRDWRVDRSTVFDRDDDTCRRCETTTDPDELRTHPVGDVPLEGRVHESALVTVCADCLETLEGRAEGPDGSSRAALFEFVRDTTRVQSDAIADVASFASVATSLPETVAGEADHADDGAIPIDDAATYRRARRDARLALGLVDARLAALEAVDDDVVADDVLAALTAVTATATDLQTTLERVVDRCERVPAGLERCHGCLEAHGDVEERADGAVAEGPTDGTCPTCGLESRGIDEWRDGDAVAFDRLFSAINDELQTASATTTTLTERATTLAERLTDS